MRHNSQLFRAQVDEYRAYPPAPPTRKMFNCIIDDTALIAGVKRSTRDGIKKWVNNGAMRLFVPLYTLESLDRMKKIKDRTGADAREAVRWLDEVTSNSDTAARVQLQGGFEVYENWADVEQFLLPETLLYLENEEEESSEEDDEDTKEDADDGPTSEGKSEGKSEGGSISSKESVGPHSKTASSPRSTYSSTSPGLLYVSPYKHVESTIDSMNKEGTSARSTTSSVSGDRKRMSSVPKYLQPLFNHILWRIHQEQDADMALESFILLSNDPVKQTVAQRFGVRVKRLEQLREVIAREERDYKSRMQLYQKDQGKMTIVSPKSPRKPVEMTEARQAPEAPDSDEEEVVFKPKSAPAVPVKNENSKKLIDPSDFTRAPILPQKSHGRGRGRGGRGGHSPQSSRGNNFHKVPVMGNLPLRTHTVNTGPIDPNSFERPSPHIRSLRGGRRTLWEPT
ncbi:hypothetical protein M501DRAFT_938500 [Patellaria atrata CBS 101060]|uniref:PIN domain-containing protein n=1 Tax=Patellaria atrata CBS 101060 TaxID=1346257 RepID=A0A9P4S857_9PEZI|nr:hypothetical protein M501DRAFT_938500 [Patellaria atrata CBS 101060]